jgi:DNA topoisomerase-1
VNQTLDYKNIVATERFSQHPPRYTEASLVRKLEELGIGRPSTYAPIISTIQQRGYVEKGSKEGDKRELTTLTLEQNNIDVKVNGEMVGAEKSKLMPTDIGLVVNDFLNQYFPDILDYHFTANVEKEFDEVAEGEKTWTEIMKRFYDHFHPSVEATMAIKTEHKVGERILGEDPKTGKPVSVKIGRFGPMIQIGMANDEEKPRFAQMPKGISMEAITLDEALEMFKLPRKLGEFEDKEVLVNTGRFGPYVHHGALYASIPKDKDPMTITLDESIALILAKREAEAKRHIKSFEEEPDLSILNGRFGPYISYKGSNYKIPKTVVPQDLDLDACRKLIAEQGEKKTSPRKRAAAKAATTDKPKKATAKKKTTSKKVTAKK